MWEGACESTCRLCCARRQRRPPQLSAAGTRAPHPPGGASLCSWAREWPVSGQGAMATCLWDSWFLPHSPTEVLALHTAFPIRNFARAMPGVNWGQPF